MTALHMVEGGTVEANTGRKALALQEVADLIGVSYQSVRKLCREGALRHIRVGTRYLVPADALDDFLAGKAS